MWSGARSGSHVEVGLKAALSGNVLLKDGNSEKSELSTLSRLEMRVTESDKEDVSENIVKSPDPAIINSIESPAQDPVSPIILQEKAVSNPLKRR